MTEREAGLTRRENERARWIRWHEFFQPILTRNAGEHRDDLEVATEGGPQSGSAAGAACDAVVPREGPMSPTQFPASRGSVQAHCAGTQPRLL